MPFRCVCKKMDDKWREDIVFSINCWSWGAKPLLRLPVGCLRKPWSPIRCGDRDNFSCMYPHQATNPTLILSLYYTVACLLNLLCCTFTCDVFSYINGLSSCKTVTSKEFGTVNLHELVSMLYEHKVEKVVKLMKPILVVHLCLSRTPFLLP